MATELDFNTIKGEIKKYLQGQKEFSDYNFEGSNLNILLDILAYNTHYNALYANMIVNEQFLDSSIKRANVVSLAKHLGYVPRSKQAAEVRVDMVCDATNQSQMTLQKWTKFTGKKDGKNMPFVLMDPVTRFNIADRFTFENLQLKQGVVSTWEFTVTDPQEKFELPSADIDITTMEVLVQGVGTATPFNQYVRGTYYQDYDINSLIYFVEENANGFYDIYFSDGIIGRPVETGNKIIVRYLVTTGEEGNDITHFNTSIEHISLNLSDNRFPAQGGAVRESMESIKFNAPRFYSSLGRAVTGEDYTSILLSEIPEIESIIVWGGEEEVPPKYGRVFISIKPQNNIRISQTLRANIFRVLRNRGVITILPEVVEPNYLHVGLTVHSLYDNRRVTQIRGLEENILTATQRFFRDNLQKFNRDFLFSRYVNAIDASNNAILSTLVTMTVQKRVVPTGVIDTTFNNKIVPGTLYSARFYRRIRGISHLGSIIDNTGYLYFRTTSYVDIEIGTIDYETGHIRFSLNDNDNVDVDETVLPFERPDSLYFIDNFAGFHASYTERELKITANVANDAVNLRTANNQIIVLDNTSTNVTTQEREGFRIVLEESTVA